MPGVQILTAYRKIMKTGTELCFNVGSSQNRAPELHLRGKLCMYCSWQ
jgi:hypothetical protein